jgi:ATP-dependent DNA ligase
MVYCLNQDRKRPTVLPNLEVLAKKCEALGLKPTQTTKRPGKADLVRALREHHLPPGGLPYTELTPMLCFPIWNMTEEEQHKVWTARGWCAQRKLNGCRIILHAVKDVGWFAHSRTTSLKTWRLEELTSKLLFAQEKPRFSATIDAEAMIEKPVDTSPYTSGKGETTKTSLHSTTAVLHLNAEGALRLQREQDAPLTIHAFDITNWNGQDLRKVPLQTRLHHLSLFIEAVQATPAGRYFTTPEIVTEDRKGYNDRIIAAGGEGVILKNLASPYIDSSSRSRDAWIKVKKRIEFDAYVSGFIRGETGTGWENLIGALEFSVNTEKGPHVIGYASNLTLENRKKITVYTEHNQPALHPSAYGKVAEISGQDVSARSFRLSHCTIDRWRPKDGPDAKRKEQCQASMADLKAAAEWVGA